MNDLLGGILIGLGISVFSNLFINKKGGTFDTPDFSKLKPKNRTKPKNVPGKNFDNIIKGTTNNKSVSIKNIDEDPFGSLRTPDDVKEKNKLKKNMKQKIKKISEEKIEGEDIDSEDSDYERKLSSEELKELIDFHKRRNNKIPMTNNIVFNRENVEPIRTHNFIPLLAQ